MNPCNTEPDWRTIGMVTTANGLLAIVPPYYATSLGRYWDEVYLPKLDAMRSGAAPRVNPQFEEVRLEQITHSVMNPEGYRDSERALLFQCLNGGLEIEARFCDHFGGGAEPGSNLHEVRIRLHEYDEDEDA